MKGGLSIFPSGQNLVAGCPVAEEATSQQCAHHTVLQERIKNVHFYAHAYSFALDSNKFASTRTFALPGRLTLLANLLLSRAKE
jgi:hypothetical protein